MTTKKKTELDIIELENAAGTAMDTENREPLMLPEDTGEAVPTEIVSAEPTKTEAEAALWETDTPEQGGREVSEETISAESDMMENAEFIAQDAPLSLDESTFESTPESEAAEGTPVAEEAPTAHKAIGTLADIQPEKPTPAAKSRTPRRRTTADARSNANAPASRRAVRPAPAAPILTIENHAEVETAESREEIIWHEIHNAYRTGRLLTGQLGGIEMTEGNKTIAIVDYKGFRVVIPLKEMLAELKPRTVGQEYTDMMQRQNKILGNMLGAQIDFVVRGIDSKTRSIVASRREAMQRKRQLFYLQRDAAGRYRVDAGRLVEARVIAVAEKVIRVELFGVECSILARDLAWDWVGDAHERYSVGDQPLVRILSVNRDDPEDIKVHADIKSVTTDTSRESLSRCRVQGRYAGTVTDIHHGVVYLRLSNGANAVAHSCYDRRTPGKKDEVSFVITRLDEERGVAVGIVTRIIRQNL